MALFYARVPGLREHEESLSLLTRSSDDLDNLSNEKEKAWRYPQVNQEKFSQQGGEDITVYWAIPTSH